MAIPSYIDKNGVYHGPEESDYCHCENPPIGYTSPIDGVGSCIRCGKIVKNSPPCYDYDWRTN